MPHAWVRPVATMRQLPSSTHLGVALSVLVPSPSWPAPLSPQQYRWSAADDGDTDRSPQAWRSVMLTDCQLFPATTVGRGRSCISPSPSWETWFHPQQVSWPAVVTAQAEAPPTSIDEYV